MKRLVVFLGFFLTATVFGQTPQVPDSVWYQAPLNKVQKMTGDSPYTTGTNVEIHIYASGGTEKGGQGRDSDLWQERAFFVRQKCQEWGLVVPANAVFYHLGKAGQRGVLIRPAWLHLEIEAVKKRVEDGFTYNYISRILSQKDSTDTTTATASQKENSEVDTIVHTQLSHKFSPVSIGIGVINLRYSGDYYTSVPSIRRTENWNRHLGWLIEGGLIPADEKKWDAVANSVFFIRPFSVLKLGVGYSLGVYFDSNLEWEWRADAVLFAAELVIPYKGFSFYFSLGGVYEDRGKDWGVVNSLGINFNQ